MVFSFKLRKLPTYFIDTNSMLYQELKKEKINILNDK